MTDDHSGQEVDGVPGPEPERREFLAKAGKLALTAPPALAMLMATKNRAFAHGGSYIGRPVRPPHPPLPPGPPGPRPPGPPGGVPPPPGPPPVPPLPPGRG